MTLPLPSSRSTLKARISPSRPSRSSSLVFRFQMRLDWEWSSWNLEKMGGHIRNAGWKWMLLKWRFYYIFLLLIVKKFPVDFNLYFLPPLPQDYRFLVWILKTNASLEIKPSILTTSSYLFGSDGSDEEDKNVNEFTQSRARNESKAVGVHNNATKKVKYEEET